MSTDRRLWLDWLTDRGIRGLFWTLQRVPYPRRVALMGAVMRSLGGVTGYRSRIEEQLAFIFPEMSSARRHVTATGVLDHFGRMLIEHFSPEDLQERAPGWHPEGPGWDIAEAARKEGRPILFVSGHFGNYQAARAAMNVRGYDLGALYRPMNNPYFNAPYVASLSGVGGPTLPRDRRGLASFVKHLRNGGQMALLMDQYFESGALLDFLGKPAPTALSAAEMALKYDTLLMPLYAIRAENGLDFHIRSEPPIPHSDPETMTQAINDSLSAQVREHPEQWFWVHRRWKPARADRRERLMERMNAASNKP